ncbi:hypothetical protein [Colidextribacter sp. OB.20]|uniref:hypothetical protein n=1 Tax=Colidextribacter sp. OB.20 TaxID=2304568 RepID=UPI00136FDC1C|nr:hypothetical protein [Colidextribacter sp. OB.20]
MSWNSSLYEYHKKYGGQLLAGEDDDGLLVFTWKDRPLAVDLLRANGRYGPYCHVQARIPVTLGKPYRLTIGPKKTLSGGVNSVLRAVPGLPNGGLLPADFGFPEVTKKRLIRSDNYDFTKLVLGSLDFRNALLACPEDRVEVRPGPGEEGLHLITVTTDASLDSTGGSWYVGSVADTAGQEVKDRASQEVLDEFFPRMDRFLDLIRAAYNAVTQWRMPV